MMKVVAILTLMLSTSLSARISDRGGRSLDAPIQERPREKPNGSFAIQLNGGHISRTDFGFSNSPRRPAQSHQSTVNISGLFANVNSNRPIRNLQPTSKRPFITHKTLSNDRPPKPSKQTGFNNRPSSSSSIPSHFTIQQRRTDNPQKNTNHPRVDRPTPKVTIHNHFNPPVAERPTHQENPHNHFNLPVVERPVQREKPRNHFNPPVAESQVQLSRPASAHFRPATFHFGPPPASTSSPRRPTTRSPATSHKTSSKPSTRRPSISNRPRTTQRPKNNSRNKSPPRSQTSFNNDRNRSKPTRISSHLIPKGVNSSKFVPPSSGKENLDEFGPSGNSIQAIVLSPNLPNSAKDIPPIFYPIRPNIAPSKRVKA